MLRVSAEAEQVARDQGNNRCHIGIGKEFRSTAVIFAQQFLEHHAADAGDSVDGRHGKGGDAHGHDCSC